MNATQKRKLKGEMQDLLTAQGFTTSCTDTPNLTFFTDKRVNSKSVPNIISGTNYGYITSFGIKTAQQMIQEARQ